MAGSFRNMVLLRTCDSALFAGSLNVHLRNRLKRRYEDVLDEGEKAGIRYFLDKPDETYGDICMKVFANGEVKPVIRANVRGRDTYPVHAFCGYHGEFDPNVGYMKLFLINQALALADADINEISDVLPFMPYGRQDRKDEPRVPISARLMADITEKSGAKRIVTMDMHSKQAQGFYTVPVEHLQGAVLFARHISGRVKGNLLVVSPDVGADHRAKELAAMIGAPYATISKERDVQSGQVNTIGVRGDSVRGKDVIIPDDMIDSGGTLVSAIEFLRTQGARNVYVYATHGIFSKKGDVAAEDRLRETGAKVVVTNTISRSPEYCEMHSDWLTALDATPLFAEAVLRRQSKQTLSGSLFDMEYVAKLYREAEEDIARAA